MPISIRQPADVEARIARFAARQGISKSAIVLRSIREFLDRHAQPSSFQIYEAVMRDCAMEAAGRLHVDARRESAERRPLKLASRAAIHRKHAARAARASLTFGKSPTKPSSAARRVARKPA